MYLSVPIICPITTQEKLLIPGVDMHIRMVRASPNFLLMNRATETVKVKRRRMKPAAGGEPAKEVTEEVEEEIDVKLIIEIGKSKELHMINNNNDLFFIVSIKLSVRKYKLTPILHMDIMSGLRFAPAIYPCKYHQMVEFSRVAGTSVVRETLFTDRVLPKTVYLFIVTTKRRLGDYKLK